MKISGPESLQHAQQGTVQSPKETGRASHFSDMLQKTLEPSPSTSETQKTASLSEPRALHSAGLHVSSSDDLVERTSRAIDLLDAYSRALSSPNKTLRDIEPALNAFIDETTSLYEENVEGGNDAQELHQVMEDLIRTARLEHIRFQRGDYLDSE